MELRFAVVEDRLPDAQRLESLLRLAFGGGQPLVCDHYESGDAFLAAFPSKEYQVIFLDICMEGTNGIETARILRRADPDLLLVFVTSSPEYVWDAFPVHPFDYLLKPYREEKLFQLADELRRVLFRAEPELEVRIARQQVHLPLRKIQYAMAQNHYVRIVSDDGECRAVSTFSQVEQLLRAQENFIVCNRGVILNMDKVLRLDCDCFEMLIFVFINLPARASEGQELPVRPVHTISVPPYAAGAMTPRGGPTLDFSLFGRYFLDLAIFYPGAFLCLAPLWEHVKAPRRTAVLTAALVTVICLAAAALCAIFELDSNILLLPTLLAAFWLLRWRMGPEVSVSQTAFLFAVAGVMTAVCSLLSVVLNARAEVGNDAPACLVSTSLLKLGLSAVLCIIFWFTAVQWSRWLLREYRGEAFWQSAWPLPTIYAAFLVFCMPLDPAVVLINRLMIISVLAVTISLLGIFLLLYEMYQVAREYTRSAQLDRENQLLAVESRRYTELRAYMEQTRHLRHDFRQHLHVIAGLTEAGQVDELKNYLHQYESELSEERPTLCANPAVDALAGHYDHEAHSLGVPVDWRLELPRQLAIPEADFCMMLGNLLENAFHASQKLPPEQRQVKVLARMLSPAMLGLLVENRYDGVLKRQQGILHSTKHDGMGIGLVSIQTAVSRYGGSMTVETENGLFRVNILLNL